MATEQNRQERLRMHEAMFLGGFIDVNGRRGRQEDYCGMVVSTKRGALFVESGC